MLTRDIHWLAGVLEGEGCFRTQSRSRSGGRAAELTLSMSDLDVVRRAQKMLGGNLLTQERPGLGRKTMFTIRPTGQRAVGWMMTVYPLMGERRREAIRRVLVDWRSRPVVNAIKTSCLRGHPFDSENTYQYKANHRMCKQCARTRGRAYANKKRASFIGPHRRDGRPVAA